MGVKQRGFGSVQDPERRKELARIGSQAAKAKGGGHQWTSAQAREASAKGLATRLAHKAERRQALNPTVEDK